MKRENISQSFLFGFLRKEANDLGAAKKGRNFEHGKGTHAIRHV